MSVHSMQALGQPGGAEARPMSVEALRALLPACAARGIPMLVANPDVVTVDAEMLVPMPGMLAQVGLMFALGTCVCHSAVLVQPGSAMCDTNCFEAASGPQSGQLYVCI